MRRCSGGHGHDVPKVNSAPHSTPFNLIILKLQRVHVKLAAGEAPRRGNDGGAVERCGPGIHLYDATRGVSALCARARRAASSATRTPSTGVPTGSAFSSRTLALRGNASTLCASKK